MVKNIINNNNEGEFIHYLLFAKEGPLLELINSEKKSRLIKCKHSSRISFIFSLRSVIKKKKPSIIHTHQPIDVLIAIIANIGLRHKVVRTYHGYSFRKTKRRRLFAVKNILISHIINNHICLNLYVSEDVLKHFNSIDSAQHPKHKVLYNGVQVSNKLSVSKTNKRNEIGIPLDAILLGMVGSFTSEARDQLVICKAMKEMVRKNNKIHFVFIGKTVGGLYNNYNSCYDYCYDNALLDNVHFIGQRIDVGDLLNCIDIYVHSSNYETFGIALIEAIFCELPCIVSNIPTFNEISDSGKLITTFKNGDAKDLTRLLFKEIEMINTLQTKQRINAAKDFAEKRYSMQEHLFNLHRLYKECLI